jgi:hypothetical protein
MILLGKAVCVETPLWFGMVDFQDYQKPVTATDIDIRPRPQTWATNT